MLSVAGIQSVSYYSDHAAKDDYYAEEGESPGRWGGAASELGLVGQVNPDDFKQIMSGFDPKTGAKLVQSAGADNHRPGWDFTFSAPKSVSLAYALADPEQRQQIERAQQKAVARAMQYLGQFAEVRIGKGGKERVLAQLIHASWQHLISRAQDPQLHTHCTVANLGISADGKIRTLETKQLYESKMAAGAIYRAELAIEMQRIGLVTEKDGDSFRLTGSNKDLETQYSKRRAEILEKITEKGLSSSRAKEIAALDTRQKKEVIPRSELFQRWRQEAAEHNFDYQSLLNAEPSLDPEQPKRKTDAEILQQLTEQNSTFKPQALQATVAINEVGNLDAEQAQKKAEELIKSPEIIKLRNPKTNEVRLTTKEMLQIERQMTDTAERMNTTTNHQITESAIKKAIDSRTLSTEQENALRHMTRPNQISSVVGIAGAGKSYTLGAAREAWESNNYQVIGAALSGKAAQGLEESAAIKSETIHATLKKLDEGELKLTSKTVLVIDEAGMVGSRQTAKLIDYAEQSGAKLVLVGDHRQLQPIDAGGAFKAVQSKIGAVEMTENRRQKEQWAAEAANNIRNGNALEALAEYQQRGLLHIDKDINAASRNLVKNWSVNINSIADVQDNLILASTKKEVAQLNELARQKMQDKGLLGASTQIDTTVGKFEIKEGDRILFGRNNKYLGVKNGTLGHVERITSNQILIKTDAGNMVNLYGSDYEHVSHGYAVTTHKSQGVTVENSFVLSSGQMSSSELSYVQLSRHKNEAQLYTLSDNIGQALQIQSEADGQQYDNLMSDEIGDLLKDQAKHMSREREKETTLDYIESAESKGFEPEKREGKETYIDSVTGEKFEPIFKDDPAPEQGNELELELEYEPEL